MRAGPKWQFIGALILAGILSLFASYLGFMAFAWGRFPAQGRPLTNILIPLSPLLAFPLFVFAAASFRPAALCLWALGPAYSLALFQINVEKYIGSLFHYLGLLLACICDRIAILLWTTAWLVHFGTKIYAMPHTEESAPTIGS